MPSGQGYSPLMPAHLNITSCEVQQLWHRFHLHFVHTRLSCSEVLLMLFGCLHAVQCWNCSSLIMRFDTCWMWCFSHEVAYLLLLSSSFLYDVRYLFRTLFSLVFLCSCSCGNYVMKGETYFCCSCILWGWFSFFLFVSFFSGGVSILGIKVSGIVVLAGSNNC